METGPFTRPLEYLPSLYRQLPYGISVRVPALRTLRTVISITQTSACCCVASKPPPRGADNFTTLSDSTPYRNMATKIIDIRVDTTESDILKEISQGLRPEDGGEKKLPTLLLYE
jgi:hypothetical protein